MVSELFEFSSAVRGYHYYQKYWQPEENERPFCAHEADNPYDCFTIRTYVGSTGKTVGHLPMEISRPTKFLLQRGAIVFATLSSTTYRRSPLVQGGLEIPCKVTINMAETLKNKQIIDRYKEMVDVLYSEPDGSAVLGSLLHHTIDVPKTPKQIKARKKESELKECEKPESSTSVKCKDIRAFFKSTTTVKNRDTPPATTTPSVVRID